MDFWDLNFKAMEFLREMNGNIQMLFDMCKTIMKIMLGKAILI